jgi:hypothetical protein
MAAPPSGKIAGTERESSATVEVTGLCIQAPGRTAAITMVGRIECVLHGQ